MLTRRLVSGGTPATPSGPADFSVWLASWAARRQRGVIPGDLIAALPGAAVALPLNLAIAVVWNVPPVMGLVSGAVGGFVAAFLGGAPLQVSGPAAALSTMVLLIGKDFGAAGVAAAALVVGVVQLVVYGLRVSKYFARLPEVVLAEFTTGAGLKILGQQVPEFLRFDYSVGDIARMMHRPHWLHDVS